MTVKEPSVEQREALEAYMRHPEKKLILARYRMDGLGALVDKKELPLTFLAFEVLNELALAHQAGFVPAQYNKVAPDRFSSATVEVPVNLLDHLLTCWGEYIQSDINKGSLDKSFGLAADKRRGRPFLHTFKKVASEFQYAEAVMIVRVLYYFKGSPMTLTRAFEEVAGMKKTSSETVKNAWGKHRAYYDGFLRALKVSAKKLGKD